ncbi:MAG: hypoxanthine phosphoribosyltransferase [Myxococcota bacterium]|nr:hypoxanthine phosphoribosyltransferase [Myxococcota bacterium]
MNEQTNPGWRNNVNVLYSKEELQTRIAALGSEITQSYSPDTELIMIGILKGCFLFYGDLIRSIDLPLECEFMGISSYGSDTKSSGVVQITSDLTRSIEGKDVIVVEDIVDTGLTMRYLLDNFETRRPKSLRVCTLLDKKARRTKTVHVDYVGYSIPDKFVVGYGLDYAGKYRNLPFIGVYHGDK